MTLKKNSFSSEIMNSGRRTKQEGDPDRIVLVDDVFDGVSLSSYSFLKPKSNINFARLRYGANQELILNIKSQVIFS